MSSKLDVLTAIAEADVYDREKAEDIRADFIARGIIVPGHDAASPVRAVAAEGRSAEEPSGTAEATESGDVRELARQEIRNRAASGLPELSGKQVGNLFGYSERWGRARIAEVGSSQGAASPVRAAAREDVAAAHGAASGAAVPVVPATTETPSGAMRHDPVPDVARAASETPRSATEEGGANAAEVPSRAVPGTAGGKARSWPVLLLALPAFVAIWGGWVGLGKLTGFGPVNLLPGIGGGWTINTAITLPIGVEAYAAYALRVWLSGIAPTLLARRFAMWSAIGSLLLGAGGQVAYHLMTAWGVTVAPWQITTFVSCLPVVVLGCGAALAHLLHANQKGN